MQTRSRPEAESGDQKTAKEDITNDNQVSMTGTHIRNAPVTIAIQPIQLAKEEAKKSDDKKDAKSEDKLEKVNKINKVSRKRPKKVVSAPATVASDPNESAIATYTNEKILLIERASAAYLI